MKKWAFTFLLFFAAYYSLIAAGRRVVIDSLRITDNYLIVDFRAEGIIDDKIAEGLRKGRTTTLEYKIQLWGKKGGMLNQLIEEHRIETKIFYDFWENKYLIINPLEKRLTNSIETVRERCTNVTNFRCVPLTSLQSDMTYLLIVEVTLRPLSVENYQEIKNWLSGEVKDINLKKISNPDDQTTGFGSRMLKGFMSITGFGDRVFSGKTRSFRIKTNEIIRE